jgi:hypothetical protein
MLLFFLVMSILTRDHPSAENFKAFPKICSTLSMAAFGKEYMALLYEIVFILHHRQVITVASRLGGHGFKSGRGDQLSVVFLSPSRQKIGQHLKLGHDFLPYCYQFIAH